MVFSCCKHWFSSSSNNGVKTSEPHLHHLFCELIKENKYIHLIIAIFFTLAWIVTLVLLFHFQSSYAVERESLLFRFLGIPISHLGPETAVTGYLRAFHSSCSRTSGLYLKLRFISFISIPLQFITQLSPSLDAVINYGHGSMWTKN
jgi:hypothetical protein